MGRAADIMSTELVWLPPHATVKEAALLMLDRGVGCVLVLDANSHLMGILSEGDFVGQRTSLPFSSRATASIFGQVVDLVGLQEAYREAAVRPVTDFMSEDIATVRPETELEDVVSLMLQRGIKHVAVVDGTLALGVVSRHDLLKALVSGQR